MATVTLKPIAVKQLQLRIKGISPLVTHQWSEKAKEMMREKQKGKKTKIREARDPEAECAEAMYTMPDGTPAVPAMAIKRCLSDAAHRDLGIEKTMVRKALFFHVDAHGLLPLVDHSEPEIREDMVRVGMGSADLRYRPMFKEWAVEISMDYDSELLQVDDIVNLANRAGYGVGLCEWRPQKNGDWGRFKVESAAEAG